MKNTMSEMKLPLDEIKSRLNTEKEKIIELEVLTTKQKKTPSVPCVLVFFISYISCVREKVCTEE